MSMVMTDLIKMAIFLHTGCDFDALLQFILFRQLGLRLTSDTLL